ncbi:MULTISPECIES: 3-methyl-2-oxobutanoate hydroxymethyltransferase [Gammaproteobacteria]|uniref:3-methyl-2-oxobutanoate hydroxymethyltransferase n=1 Tax=Gammaproteobacteria TaxID=1236 RepID=UPI000DCF8142|nr:MULTISPECIES: 3-methyl-2-oxobutanoate hydroxymethyltransferase [Gammaproteobacteria]RTE85645.1 3-methyl-2-oxobutanoate hydroxymethyltransferase [Aliidiomarina sp. B3213]TCZ89614.1 3-methyl-2-oxobutanoate hydroxymethyltransferase [Lysobacter sp. N42]
MSRIQISKLFKMKKEGEKITALTAYDASFSKLFADAGVEVMLIGDSLGMVLHGDDSTLAVSVEDIAYHTSCVRKGAPNSFVIADMPFMSYSTPNDAAQSAAKLMRAGANMVKMEGGQHLADTVKHLTQHGIPVCAHLGLLPQQVNVIGGYRVQGKTEQQANQLIEEGKALQEAGAQLLVVECIPKGLGKRFSEALSIPVIGIGAGAETDGQILVMHDMLGMNADYLPKFTKNFLANGGSLEGAVSAYVQAVKRKEFPAQEHTFE